MARRYAVIMGLLSLTVVLLRAAKNGGGFETTVGVALGWMALFTLIGGIVGSLAQTTVEESMRLRISRELAEIAAARAAADQAEAAR